MIRIKLIYFLEKFFLCLGGSAVIEMDMAFIPSAEDISVVEGKLHGVVADILEIFVVADINPGTERCALRLWHPDFENG